MNACPDDFRHQVSTEQAERLLRSSMAGFAQFAMSLRPLLAALQCVESLGNADAVKAAARVRRQIEQFEPSVTMIGQIKSGKTTLVNCMIGLPDLLPADVNPWTSVVTSLHLCPRASTPPTRAKFRFFDNTEWERLVTGGGRIGELADRAGADEELSKIIAQAATMREKARTRLGRKFELLLGSEQNYGYFDKDLVERYVCLGDQDAETSRQTKAKGYFADITRSADLFMQQRAIPINLCIRDTPGVNDTFMVREQITIKAIRDSRICVVILSAHQALSSTDLALIRIISNVKSREVIIFVNRIDELSDPSSEVPQIRASIEQTLINHNGPGDAQIIFGSALWAQKAALGTIAGLPKASQEALFNWAETAAVAKHPDNDPHDFVWQLSGLPTLYAALSDRIIEGEGGEMAGRAAVLVGNLLNGIRVADNLAAKTDLGDATLRLSHGELDAALATIRRDRIAQLEQELGALQGAFQTRIERSHDSFLARATEALAKHLEVYGENSAWTYDPAGLRILLNSAYKIFGIRCQTAYCNAAAQSVADLKALCTGALGLGDNLFEPDFPPPPHVSPPVTIGQTIALDLRGSWWKGWWTRRQDYMTQARRFHDLIKAESQGLIRDLSQDQARLVHDSMRAQLEAFLTDQSASLTGIFGGGQKGPVRIDQLLGVRELKERDALISAAQENLQRYVT